MIPLKLNIKNFLSYGENAPTLDFAGIHVACLCGDNGHGKSALLDAITWCLWGEARGRIQDDLIHYGADNARVDLEFLARGNRYRVIRNRSRPRGQSRQGSGDLQLQVISETEGGGAQNISGNTIRETQRKIERLVGMDYDTFINSAFLLQGRADEFTSKTPAERKAVLASILGLDAYDRFQGRARERLNDRKSKADQLEGSFAQLRRDIAEIGDPTAELARLEENLVDLTAQLNQRRSEREAGWEKVNRLIQLAKDAPEQKKRIENIEAEIGQIEANKPAATTRIENCRRLIDQADDITAGYARLVESRKRFEALEATRRRYEELSQQKNKLTQDVNIKRERLVGSIEELRRQMEREATKAQAEAGLSAERESADRRLEELKEREEKLAVETSRLQALVARIGEANAMMEACRVEGEQIKEKLRLLENSDPDSALCPLCQTSLQEDGCQRLSETYQREIEEKRLLYRNTRNQLSGLEREKETGEKESQRQAQVLGGERDKIGADIARLELLIQGSQQAQGELAKLETRLSGEVAALESGGFAEEEWARLAQLANAIEDLAYDEESHRQCYRLIQELEGYDRRQAELTQAEAQLLGAEEALSQAEDMLIRRRRELAEGQEQLRSGAAAAEQLPGAKEELRQLDLDLAKLDGNHQSALGRKGLLEGQERRREFLQGEIERSEAALSALQEEQGIYQELVNAFGRQGIQAMLIETVVPRLEEEANVLLGRMTDNRMHVKLETQRERRSGSSGELIETLQINVSDEMGTRSYEMYSGGESFRVNLALRIALSRVLSQRTGAPLPTLFIDEGLGTQDASGRERILDVISSIEDDFDKIIVITHLDDLKDMFPVRIEVQKDSGGSTFWIN